MSADIQSLIESAVGGNKEDMRTLLLSYYDQHNVANQANGTNWLAPTNQKQQPFSSPPPAATMAVSGANGIYHVQITNPSQSINATIYHEVSYSPIQSFGQGVTTLPATAATAQTVPAPGQTRFFRLRSSYDRQNWNSYVTQTTSVSSGLQSSAAQANHTVLDTSNYAFIDSIDAGATANVRIFGASGPYTQYTSVKGSVETVQPSATIVNVAHASTQVVAYDGENYRLSTDLPSAFPDTWTPTGTVSVVGTGSVGLPVITPVIQSGHIITATFTPGSGLTQAPTLTITDSGGGTGASAIAIISGGEMTGIQILNAGSGYSGATLITPTGGVFSGATGGGQHLGGNNGRLVF